LATSITIAQNGQPVWPQLVANGVPAPVDGVELIGELVEPRANLWRLRPVKPLLPTTNYVLTVEYLGTRVELTRFSTAAAPASVGRHFPAPKNLKFWQVRYPMDQVRAENCIASEYHGFVHFDYDLIEIPGTPSDSVIYTIHLEPDGTPDWPQPKQAISFMADAPYRGKAPAAPDYRPGLWSPNLGPYRKFCVSITALGFNDLEVHNTLHEIRCATVEGIDLNQTTSRDSGTSDAASAQCPSTGCQCVLAMTQDSSAGLPYWAVLVIGIILRRRKLTC
jgi:hypothetical protein